MAGIGGDRLFMTGTKLQGRDKSASQIWLRGRGRTGGLTHGQRLSM